MYVKSRWLCSCSLLIVECQQHSHWVDHDVSKCFSHLLFTWYETFCCPLHVRSVAVSAFHTKMLNLCLKDDLLNCRQSHKSFFDKSDLFFVCMLQPLSFDIHKQDAEIEAAQWMPFEQYAAQPFVHGHELLRYISDICSAKMEGRYTGFSSVPTVTSFSQKNTYLYMNGNVRTNSRDDPC